MGSFFGNLEAEIAIPEDGILSRTLFTDDSVKIIGFGFSAGQELSAHTAPMAAILYFVKGDAAVTLGEETVEAHAGSMAHMPPMLPHSILAKTPLVMILVMLKQVRA